MRSYPHLLPKEYKHSFVQSDFNQLIRACLKYPDCDKKRVGHCKEAMKNHQKS